MERIKSGNEYVYCFIAEILEGEQKKDKFLIEDGFSKLLDSGILITDIPGDIWNLLSKYDISISDYVNSISLNSFVYSLNHLFTSGKEKWSSYINFLSRYIDANTLNGMYLAMEIAKQGIKEKISTNDLFQIESAILSYIFAAQIFYDNVYKDIDYDMFDCDLELRRFLYLQVFRNKMDEGNFQDAMDALKECQGIYDEIDGEIATFYSLLSERYADEENNNNLQEFLLKQRIIVNPSQYTLYLKLGGRLIKSNPKQAYLCFENAYQHCPDEGIKEEIKLTLCSLKEAGVYVNKTAIVILSYNLLVYTKKCIESIEATTPDLAREIIIVDNASKDGSLDYLRTLENIILVENEENEGFPKGCNIGIEAAESNSDILLLNNDTLLTENALFWLRMALYENDEVGAAGSMANYVSNLQSDYMSVQNGEILQEIALFKNVWVDNPYTEKLYLVGFSVLLKREVLNQIGLLDERFTPGNFEDNDLGLRIAAAGFKNILCKNSFIVHFGSKSFGKEKEKYSDVLIRNKEKFESKWNLSKFERYMYYDQHIVQLVNKSIELGKGERVLFINAGYGEDVRFFRRIDKVNEYIGLELDKEKVIIGNSVMDNSLIPTALIGKNNYRIEEFDYIVVREIDEELDKKLKECFFELYSKNDFNQYVYKKNWKDYWNKYNNQPQIAICVATYNQPEVVESVIKDANQIYSDYGIDLVYFDSSTNDLTEEVVKNEIQRGADNLKYVRLDDKISVGNKEIQILSGHIAEEYDYIWLVKDRVEFKEETVKRVIRAAQKNYDIIFLGEIETNQNKTKEYFDETLFYKDWGFMATSMDVTVYNTKTVKQYLNDNKRYKDMWPEHVETFMHFDIIFNMLAELQKKRIFVLCSENHMIYTSKASKGSSWTDKTFHVLGECWIEENESLPDMYAKYADKVIKDLGVLPWFFESENSLKHYQKLGLLDEEIFRTIMPVWNRLTDIPLEVLEKYCNIK